LRQYYEVILLNRDTILTYFWNGDIELYRYVKVPILEKLHDGIIYRKVAEKDIKFNISKILPINMVLDTYLPFQYFKTAVFIKNYYFNSLSSVLKFFPRHPINYNSPPRPHRSIVDLNSNQEKVFNEIWKEKISLIFGDTGTGKTRIYKRAISKVLEDGGDIVFLVPEINIIPQTERRLKDFFGYFVESWHSKIGKRKIEIREKIVSGEVKIIVGTVSALFLPFQNLKLIIVDEEHSSSYFLNDGVKFSVRDMAIYLGKELSIKTILGSATPSLRSYHKFPTFRLKTEHSRKFIFDKYHDEVSPTIVQKISEKINKSEQVIVFVPIRGNFKSLTCMSCGKSFECPNCTIKLSLYSKDEKLKCNRCGFIGEIPEKCDECGSDGIRSSKLGTVEIANRIKEFFPKTEIASLDSDKTKKEGELQNILNDFRSGKTQILVGTQMISKGHDYQNVSLSIIIGIDFLINLHDFQSFENSISLIYQIAGRSGRSGFGETILQTQYRDLYSSFLNDYEDFIKFELGYRKNSFPPFRHIYLIEISHSNQKRGLEILDHLTLYIHFFSDLEILYSDAGSVEKVDKKWKFEILLRGDDISKGNSFLSETLSLIPKSFNKWIEIKNV
jgi:primosomal protein N' (replication factor Y)